MELWIPVTLAAALFQTVRFMLQKRLSTTSLSTAGSTFSRFFYSAPLVAICTFLYLQMAGLTVPDIPSAFWVDGMVGGIAQILATVCVVALFRVRNFAVGVTFKKTEVLQTAIMGFVVLGEGVGLTGAVAIGVGLIGLLVLSDKKSANAPTSGNRFFNRAAGLGILSGFLFAISAVSYRSATLEVATDNAVLRAAITLAAVTAMQTLAMAIWLRVFEAGQIAKVWASRKTAIFVGITSMGGSFCWFLAFTLQNAAYVKALGQVELIFSIMATQFVFRESIARKEILGIVLLLLSIVILVAGL